jgi:hypothetical protein
MPNFSQIKESTFHVVAIFFAIAVAYVCVSDDGLNVSTVVLSPELKTNSSSLCIRAKNYDFRLIKLLFCTRDVEVKSEVDRNMNRDRVRIKIQNSSTPFFTEVDSFARIWHFTNREEGQMHTRTVHMSPFASVCFQPCVGECTEFPVTSKLVFNKFFTGVFIACLGVALILRILAHRCWRFLSTSVMSVALPCVIIFLIASRRASATWAGIWALGGGGFIVQYGKPYVWDFIRSPVGQAVLVVYIAAIIAANYFLPTPQYNQKSAVAWLGRIVCAAVVLVVSPLVLIPAHQLQEGVPSSYQVPPNIILALSVLLLCIIFDSFSLGVQSDEHQLNHGTNPPPQQATSALSHLNNINPNVATNKHHRACSPQPQSRDSFASPEPTSHLPFHDPEVNRLYELYKQRPEEWR